jgi:lysophospholipase L1-like esterase
VTLAAVLLTGSLTGCDDAPADGRSDRPAATRPSPSSPSPSSPSPSSLSPSSPSPSSPSPSSPSPAGPPRFARYVALGDSYTAAPGVPRTETADRCLRSTGNYPHLLAARLPVRKLVDVSCSGADTADVRRPQLAGIPPQLDAVTPRTDLVTIGLGGNDDELFGRLLASCLRRASSGSPCRDTLRSSVPQTLAAIEQNLLGVVADVRTKAPSARILLVGYPQIIPADRGCAEAPFAAGDDRFAREVNRGLTEAVRRAAAASRTAYVDLWRASAGHDICSADPWINGLSGPGAAPFHPFAVEQVAVARLVAAALG